jgi:hypothetical protein
MARKKLTDAQIQFIAGDDLSNQSGQQVNAEILNDVSADLKKELFGDRQSKESSIRFTVDIPSSLNKRLSQLSVDTGKPKTELVRTIIDKALNSLDY